MWGQRPTAVLMRDPFFGHRDWFGDPVGDPDLWVEWDFVLASAVQVIEDLTDKHGIPVWVSESEGVVVDAVKRIDKFQASIDRKTKGTAKKPYVPEPGESWIPDVVSRVEGFYPSYRDYVAGLREGGRSESWGEVMFGKSFAELKAERSGDVV